MNLEAIADRIVGLRSLVKGTSIFVNSMPDTCKFGVLLIPPYHGTPINHEMPGYVVSEFRLVVRGENYVTTNALANQLVGDLTINKETVIGDMSVKQMHPMNLPRPYRRSVGGFHEFEVDVGIVFGTT